ncbi:MAG: hypothetical protein GEU98_06980 [Pseudonocardiaceae bacterium]|nr:hypothetical protein [Pseudonocardiaceae bacterium]
MSDTALLLIALVIIVATPVAMVAIFRYRKRYFGRENSRSLLQYQHFAGQPEVVVDPALWEIGPQEIRTIAGQQGYTEVPSRYPGTLMFHRQPAPGPVSDTPCTPHPRPMISNTGSPHCRTRNRSFG